MKKILFPVFGLLALILSACAAPATPTPPAVAPVPQASAAPTEAPAQSAPTSAATTAPTEPAPTQAAAATVSFANDVLPILNNSCTSCHDSQQMKAGLDLSSYTSVMAGSVNGPVIVAGDANNSYLIQLILSGEMPRRGPKLSDSEIQIITNWVNAGAPNN